jgi:hypothetical protein
MGERFARALAAKDAAGLKALLRPDVDFAAMTPSRFWESRDAEEVVDDTILGTWFAPDRRINELSTIESGDLGPLERVGYQFDVTLPDGEFGIQQQAYLRVDDQQISWLRIMCTGFVPR